MSETVRDALLERYPFECPSCGAQLFSRPSIAMEMGDNCGQGTCIECRTHLHLEITPDLTGDRMAAEPMTDWLARTYPDADK